MSEPVFTPSVDDWRGRVSLDSATGHLTNRLRVGHFLAGTRAGTLAKDGYRYIRWNRRAYCEHRVIWALVHGRWPDQVDHVNMDRSDNRPENLREASVTQNNQNRPKQSNNTTGFKGVTFHKGTGKYNAKIMGGKVRRNLGYFNSAEEASAAYQAAAKELHGEFARTV